MSTSAKIKCNDCMEDPTPTKYESIEDIFTNIYGVIDQMVAISCDTYHRGTWNDKVRERSFFTEFTNTLKTYICDTTAIRTITIENVESEMAIKFPIERNVHQAARDIIAFITKCTTSDLKSTAITMIVNEWNIFMCTYPTHRITMTKSAEE